MKISMGKFQVHNAQNSFKLRAQVQILRHGIQKWAGGKWRGSIVWT